MASRSQTQDDYIGVSPTQNDNALELFPFEYNDRDIPIHFPFPFPFLRPQITPAPVENFPSGAVRDFNMITNVNEHNRNPFNNPVNQDVIVRNNIPMLDNQVFSSRSVGPGTISSGSQTSNNNMMSAYRGVNRVPYSENSHGSGTQNRAEISNDFTKFSSEPRFEQIAVPRGYGNHIGIHSSHPNIEEELDGRFLSLGNQGQVSSYMNSHDGKASHHVGDFSITSKMIDNFFHNVSAGVDVFENNVGGAPTPLDSVGNQTLSADYCGLRAMTSGLDTSPITNIDEGRGSMHHYIHTPNTLSSGSGKKPIPIIDLSDPSECSNLLPNVPRYDDLSSQSKRRRMQRASFNSSVLRSNHQIAAETQQNSHLSTSFLLPPSGTSVGESDTRGKSDLALGFITSSSGVQTAEAEHFHRSNKPFPAGQICPPFPVNNELPYDSSSKSESLKRIINLPPRDTKEKQRRKLTHQTSVQQFSPDLLQNALGQVPVGNSTSSVKAFNIPNPLKDFATSGWPRNASWPFPEPSTGTSDTASPQHSIPLTPPFVPPTSEDTPPLLADFSTIPVVCVDSPPRVFQPVNAPPVALGRTTASQCGSPSTPMPAASTKRVMTANIPAPPPPCRSASAIASQRSNLLHTSSTVNRSVRTDWKKSLPTMAGLSALRASQVLGSMPRIKWQGFETAPVMGYKCMICNRDLSFTPEGPVVQPAIPPAVAVLPCGHTFHDHCLLLITPHDQSKDPPCIPCAVDV